ncbi:XRE family transcriptional regulator [Micromonospora zingiberis]|uniref:XRE family transcriptional regulator n=1 Tax=Micromonospora zingiberis TaxID=2053011 RepID=A0A4R0G4J3_9ACTN|nr:helix-turn-helix transcriptional regulator [Micromonospora zingiberis]TCB91620.1 XRE family transcriptional regulator [Micromonospora zingiberis]
MATDGYGATIAKRRLARRLTELRVRAGYTANQVCDKLAWGRGKVGRFEANAWRRPEMSDIRDLLRIYGATDDECTELERLAITARERPWWREYPDVFEDGEFAGFEADATTISAYMPLIVPGLLQTRAYAEAWISRSPRPPEWRHRALESRLRRQEILVREQKPPRLVAVITEASLMYRWGTQDDRRAQVQHLVTMGRRPNVEVRLLRFADGLHPGISGMINIFSYPDDPALVFMETDTTIRELSDLEDARMHMLLFNEIRDAALSPAKTTKHLTMLAETLE